MNHPLFGFIDTLDHKEIQNGIADSKKKAEKLEKETRQKAIAILKLHDSEEWKTLAEFIEELKVQFSRKPEDYYANEKLIGIDAGARAALTLLTDWIKQQVTIATKK